MRASAVFLALVGLLAEGMEAFQISGMGRLPTMRLRNYGDACVVSGRLGGRLGGSLVRGMRMQEGSAAAQATEKISRAARIEKLCGTNSEYLKVNRGHVVCDVIVLSFMFVLMSLAALLRRLLLPQIVKMSAVVAYLSSIMIV